MIERTVALLVSSCLLLSVFSCGERSTSPPAAQFSSPKVIAADGSQLSLPTAAIYPIDGEKVSRTGLELVCEAAGVKASPEAADQIWFGENIFGAGLASVVFFGKHAASLDDSQWKALASIAAAPERCQDALDPEKNTGTFSPHAHEADRVPECSYMDAMTDQIADDIAQQRGVSRNEAFRLLYSDGVTVETPFRPEIQAAAERVYSDKTSFTDSYSESFPQSAFAAIDYSGSMVALVGGNNGNHAYDRAWRTLHPIGSSIKPLSVYSPALIDGRISFSSLVDDSPIPEMSSPQEQWPRNYDRIYDGEITVTYALRQSKNTVPVRLVIESGPGRSFDFLSEKLGFTTLAPQDKDIPNMALGYLSRGVSVTELAAAYQVFGSGGIYTPPAFYTKVTDAQGNVLAENRRQPIEAMSSADAWIMNRLLYYNISKDDGIAYAARLSDGREVIGKTGTVDNELGLDSDRLFVGGTPDLCAAVWLGYDQAGASIEDVEYKTPAAIWRAIFEQIPGEHDSFQPDGSVIEAEYCTESGGLACDKCQSTETGYYKEGTLPESCPLHS